MNTDKEYEEIEPTKYHKLKINACYLKEFYSNNKEKEGVVRGTNSDWEFSFLKVPFPGFIILQREASK